MTPAQLWQQMLRIRRFEERCAELYGDGKIRGFLHLYIGEEAVAVGAMSALSPQDAVVATYREHGHALARGISAEQVLAEMYGKVTGTCRGRGGSMHLFDAATRFFGGWAIVGGGLPIAVGLALADKQLGRASITACFFGDGAVAEGEFHESLNLASLWKLPVLFLCENNLYAMGTALVRHQAQLDFVLKARGYDIDGASVDGMDVLAVREAAAAAVAQVRSGKGPFFLECRTYRFRAHSMFDPELYRSKEEVQRWRQLDPIETLAQRLSLGSPERSALEAQVADEIARAVASAETADVEPVAELLRHVQREAP